MLNLDPRTQDYITLTLAITFTNLVPMSLGLRSYLCITSTVSSFSPQWCITPGLQSELIRILQRSGCPSVHTNFWPCLGHKWLVAIKERINVTKYSCVEERKMQRIQFSHGVSPLSVGSLPSLVNPCPLSLKRESLKM